MHDPETLVQSPRRSRWRRRLLWLGLPLLVLVVAFAGVYYYVLTSAGRDLRAAVEEIERRDERWQFHQIEEDRVTPPDDQNAALTVLAVRKLLPANWPPALGPNGEPSFLDATQSLPPEEQLSPELHKQGRAELNELGPALAEARKLADQRSGRYPVAWAPDFFSTVLLGQEARAAANLLQMEALRKAQEGDADGALIAVRALLNAGRSLGDEPMLLSQLIRLALQALTARVLERVLAQGQPSEKELAALQQLLEDEAGQPLLWYAVRGERAGMHKTWGLIESGEVSISQLGGGGGPAGTLDRVGEFAVRGLARQAHTWYLRYMTDMLDIARLPVHEQPPRLKEVEATVAEAPILARLAVPAVSRVAQAFQRNQALVRAALAAVAVERYRVQNGRWPTSLGELVGKQLREVPLDPYDGKPLRYRHLPDGVVIYAVGPDGEDNQGTIDRAKPLDPGKDPGFRLWDVARRRQAPPPKNGK